MAYESLDHQSREVGPVTWTKLRVPEITQSVRNSAATISIRTTSLRPRSNPTGIPDRPGPGRGAKFAGRIADHSTRLNRDLVKTNARRQSQGRVTLAAVLSSRVVRANRCRLLLAVASRQRRARVVPAAFHARVAPRGNA